MVRAAGARPPREPRHRHVRRAGAADHAGRADGEPRSCDVWTWKRDVSDRYLTFMAAVLKKDTKVCLDYFAPDSEVHKRLGLAEAMVNIMGGLFATQLKVTRGDIRITKCEINLTPITQCLLQ